MKPNKTIFAILVGLLIIPISTALAQQGSVLEQIKIKAGGVDFSAKRGAQLFSSTHKGGQPDTPSCTSCHSKSPLQAGQTRAGKKIAPMAVSKMPDRYTNAEKVEKWFRRNCNTVLGRECTPLEKGDFITYMKTQ